MTEKNDMQEKLEVCAICAWRDTCQKKFNISGRDVRCPDFCRDMSIGTSAGEEHEDTGKEE
jgi:hypothetical protein